MSQKLTTQPAPTHQFTLEYVPQDKWKYHNDRVSILQNISPEGLIWRSSSPNFMIAWVAVEENPIDRQLVAFQTYIPIAPRDNLS